MAFYYLVKLDWLLIITKPWVWSRRCNYKSYRKVEVKFWEQRHLSDFPIKPILISSLINTFKKNKKRLEDREPLFTFRYP